MSVLYRDICLAAESFTKLLAVLIDPDKFLGTEAGAFLQKIPPETTHIFIGGSTAEKTKTQQTVEAIKAETRLPVILFPGHYSQIANAADGVLFLSLISGRNPEYLIEQQVKAVGMLKNTRLEVIPTGYILIDGGKECAVQKVSGTCPIPQDEIGNIIDTALAGQFSGKQLIYLEAGSGAYFPVSEEIIRRVKAAITIPLVVGGGIRSSRQLRRAYQAGADMVVMGTFFETDPLPESVVN